MTDETEAARFQQMAGEGMWAMAVANCLASGTAAVLVGPDDLANLFFLVLATGAVGGATLCGPFLWRVLVARDGRFHLVPAVLVGVLSVIAGHVAMWFAYGIATLINDFASFALQDLPGFVAGLFVMALFSGIVLAVYTFPLGIAAALLVTLWCRSRMT